MGQGMIESVRRRRISVIGSHLSVVLGQLLVHGARFAGDGTLLLIHVVRSSGLSDDNRCQGYFLHGFSGMLQTVFEIGSRKGLLESILLESILLESILLESILLESDS
jgi:hypothetical protein